MSGKALPALFRLGRQALPLARDTLELPADHELAVLQIVFFPTQAEHFPLTYSRRQLGDEERPEPVVAGRDEDLLCLVEASGAGGGW